jgi:hypothetical protein
VLDVYMLSVTLLVADVAAVTDAITKRALLLHLLAIFFPSDSPTKILK